MAKSIVVLPAEGAVAGQASAGQSGQRSPELLAVLGQRLDKFTEQLTPAERSALSALLKIGKRNPALVALAAEPPEAVLAPAERAVFEELMARPAPAGQSLRSAMVVVMKSTRYCNLRCTYCRFWEEGPNQIMSFDVLAHTMHHVLRAPTVEGVDFCWHGGEATLLPPEFYRKALWLQEQFRRPGQIVENSIQTNGTRLTPAWLDFIKRFRLNVGVSLDGPPELNDRRRLTAGGKPTAAKVRHGLAQLTAHGISYGVLIVVDDDVVEVGAERLLEFFLEIGVRQVALLNALPDNHAETARPYYEFGRHVEFLRDLFRRWWPAHADRIDFRELSDLLVRLSGDAGKICVYNGNCMGGFLTIEPRGEIGACDKFLGDGDYSFGNVLAEDLSQLAQTQRFVKVHAEAQAGVEGAESCKWFNVCHGGCPHDRYLRGRKQTAWDERCCGLEPLLDDMAEALARRREPATA